MKPFRRRQGRVHAEFEPYEAQMIVTFARQVVELLRDDNPEKAASGDPLEDMLDFDGPVDTPDDPVLARLLPGGYAADDEAAADFRRYTERALRQGKITNAQQVIDSLHAGGLDDAAPESEAGDGSTVEVELDHEAAQSWLRSLTDIRLALGTRLGVDDDDQERWDAMPDDHPEGIVHDVYDWLGFVQESLLHALG